MTVQEAASKWRCSTYPILQRLKEGKYREQSGCHTHIVEMEDGIFQTMRPTRESA